MEKSDHLSRLRPSLPTTSISLLRAARLRGSDAAWEALVEIYSPSILEACRRGNVNQADRLDLCNEVWLAVHRGIDGFHRKGKFAFRAWLRTITQNKIRDFFRKAPDVALSNDLLDQRVWASGVEDSVHDAPTRFLASVLSAIRDRFGEDGSELFFRLVVQGDSAQDIADELKIKPGAIYTRKARMLQWLRSQKLEQLDGN